MKDEDIISLARQNSQILITEDKDFGEWIFAHQLSGLTIIFLRYDKEDYTRIISFLKTELKTIDSGENNEFITIYKSKVRRRRI